MKDIKKMLLGIAIMLAVIVLHLFLEDGFLPDLIAIVGLAVVVMAYFSGNEEPIE